MRKPIVLGAAALSVAVLAAACGSSSSPSSTPATDTAAPPTSTDAGTTTAVANAPQKGGTLVLIDTEPLDQWDGQAYYGKQWQMEYETTNCLVDFYPLPGDQESTLIPGLAADMPTVSADGTEYTFTIRDGLIYSDGSPVQAQDVKDYMERILDPGMGTDGALGSGYYSIIQGVDEYSKTDDAGKPAPDRAKDIAGITVEGSTVKFKLTAADNDFLFKMSLRFVCPMKPGGPHIRSNKPEPSTGPYMISEVTDTKTTFVRNPNWDTNAKIMGLDQYADQLWNVDGWTIETGISPDAQILKLKNNEADMSWNGTAVSSLAVRKQIEGDPALASRFIAGFDPFVRYLGLDTSTPPFDNVKLRQAANYAIDRAALVKINGDGQPWSEVLGAALVPEGHPQPYPPSPDVEKAKALVAESGVKTPIEIKYSFNDTPPGPDAAANNKAALEAVGFKVTLVPHPAAGYYSFAADPKNGINLRSGGWAPDWPDGGASFGPLLSSATAGTSQNLANVKDPALDAKIAEIQKMPYGPERKQAWADLSLQYATDTPPWVTTRNGEELNFNSERLQGFHYNAVKLVTMNTLWLKQ